MNAPNANSQTNPAGLCFVSYRRSRLDEIRVLLAALHEHGIPTWHDLSNLDEEPLEPALRVALADRDVASGVLWITSEIADSPIITGLEIPGLTSRDAQGDGFYVVPVAAGGLDYEGAARATRTVTTLDDFAHWNVLRVANDPIDIYDATSVARRVLSRRVTVIHHALPSEAPFVVDLFTRMPVVKKPDAALTVDLTHRFAGRHAQLFDWEQYVLPAFEAIVETIATRAPRRPMQFRGLVGLPAALALGTTLLAPRGLAATWMQLTPGMPAAHYSLTVDRRDCGFKVELRDGRPTAADLGISVNVSGTTIPAIQATHDLPLFRGWVQADPPLGNRIHMFPEAGEALDLAHRIIAEVRVARARYANIGDIHLFIAGPVGLAFLLGQLLNTLGRVHTYEFVSDTATGHYRPAVILRPAG